ncbi:MAG: lipocalin family protein [Proteobacteria bacterium]|jgi:apolipoprotein D and lipocalin family protein|nr:lipocalin family protein [Pseudomonadota bacterium]
MNKISLLFVIMVGCIKLAYANAVTPITDFNINQYLGTWYEIARLPNSFENKCTVPITANYSTNPDNKNQLIVVNQCNTKDNNPKMGNGVAYFVESANIGKLEVTFLPKWLRWLPFGYGDYWVLYTDYDTVAVIGSPNHEYLWILARVEDLKRDVLEKALLVAKNQGFDTDKLIFNYKSEQSLKESQSQ